MSTASQTPLRRRPRSIVAPKFEPSSLRLAASGLLLLLPAVMGDALFSARTEQPEPAAQVRTDRYGDLLPDGAIARLGTVRWRLGFMLRSLAYSPDSKRIAANDNRGNVLALWDAVTGKVLCRIPNVNQLLGPVFSPDGKLIATAFQSDCSLWDTATGKEVRRLKGHTNDVRGVAFSPDGKQIATGSDDGTLRLWDLATGKEQRRIECRSGRFYPLAYSPDGKMIASSSVDGVIHFWDQATGKERHRLVGHKNAARSLAFSQDGKRLTSFADGMIRRWDRATGRPLRTLGVKEISLGWPNALSPDGATLATVNIADTKIRLWDVEEGVEKRRWEASAQTEAFAFSPDGKMLASGTPWGIIRLWDTTTGRERQPTDVPHGFIKFVRYSPDGSSLVSISSDCRVLWWDLATQKSRRQFTWTGEGRFPMKLSPDGNTLAVMESSASTKPEWEVHLLDVRTGKLLGLQKSLFWSMAFSPDSRLVAFGRKEHRIHVWDVSNRKEIRQINDVPDGGMSLCFSPDSKSLAYGSRGNNPTKLALHLCDVASGKDRTVRILESPYLARLAFSPDGRVLTIIAGNPNTYLVCLWDTVSGKELYRYTGHHEWGGVWSFSPDGKLVAESPPFQRGQITRPLHVWELATGQRIRRFEGHPSFVDSVDFAPDGLSVASGGYDATILLWDITGRCQDGRWHVKPLTPRELEACWMALANEDAAKAYDAVWELAAAPEQAVPFLRKHLSPMPRPDAKAVARWIADLDSSDFAIRQKTNDELSKLGDAIAPALRSALPGKPSLETRRRVQQLLDQSRDWTPERLRVHRAIQALEHISTPSACEVLQTLAEGAPEARRTEEAKTALRRVAR